MLSCPFVLAGVNTKRVLIDEVSNPAQCPASFIWETSTEGQEDLQRLFSSSSNWHFKDRTRDSGTQHFYSSYISSVQCSPILKPSKLLAITAYVGHKYFCIY